MLFVCHPKSLHKRCLQFLSGVEIAPRETENNAYAKFWVTNKEHYGMLWYFLEWSILGKCYYNLRQVLPVTTERVLLFPETILLTPLLPMDPVSFFY